jgi:hypothetical protein
MSRLLLNSGGRLLLNNGDFLLLNEGSNVIIPDSIEDIAFVFSPTIIIRTRPVPQPQGGGGGSSNKWSDGKRARVGKINDRPESKSPKRLRIKCNTIETEDNETSCIIILRKPAPRSIKCKSFEERVYVYSPIIIRNDEEADEGLILILSTLL